MKHSILRKLLLFVVLLTYSHAFAYDFEVDGIYYNILSEEDKTCEVTFKIHYVNSKYPSYNNSVIIPEKITYNNIVYSITKIGTYAFDSCDDLISITIPNSVTCIADYAFYCCTGLTCVELPNSITSIGDSAFSYCNNLKSITLPDSIISLGKSTFYGCSSLASLTIPISVTNIGECTFLGCTGLTSIVIPSSITSIDSSAFRNCIGLTSISLPNSVKIINENAFSNCTGLTSVIIPSSVTSISKNAFSGCNGLSTIAVDSDNERYDSRNNCNSIIETSTNTLILGCKNTIIPNSITNIGWYAFAYCTGLTSIIIPNSVTTIGNYAFGFCTNLESITIGENVTTIDSFAFYNCENMTNITIPNSVTSISGRAFSGCSNLKSITIPNRVTEIGDYAFGDCTNLTNITIMNKNTSIGNKTFYGCTGLGNIQSIVTTPSVFKFFINNSTNFLSFIYINNKYYTTNDRNIEISDLQSNKSYYYGYGLKINNVYCLIGGSQSSTQSFSIEIEGNNGVSFIHAKATYYGNNVKIIGTKLSLNNENIEYDNINEKTFSNLEPNTNYSITYTINTEDWGLLYTSKTFTTNALTWSDEEYQATSTTSARLMTTTNCDAQEGTGFEWRRYGAPENLKPNVVSCPVVDGMLIGSLRNLNSEAYYEFRPFYKSASGNTYYGEWTALFTGDANVYFEPEVRTYSDVAVKTNNATLKGYALAGTDDIISQGFEYWKSAVQPSTTNSLSASNETKKVEVSGITMTTTIGELEYGTTYCYRAYATTSKGTIYGDTVEFTTDKDLSGIESVVSTENESVEYYNLQGVRVVNPERGLYIKRQGEKTTKVVL